MNKEYLLYKLMSDKTYFQNFLNLIKLQRSSNKRKYDELSDQKFYVEKIENNISYLRVPGTELNYIQDNIKLITESLYYGIEYIKHVENCETEKDEINTLESVLIYLLNSGKLSVRSATEVGFTIEYLNSILNHYQMYISPQGELVKNENSWMFLEFMLENSFKPEDYNNILELMQSVPNSLSQYLTNYKQFLLSEMVSYTDLETYNIKGAKGYIDADEGIVVPKSIEADGYFRNHQEKVPNKQIPRYVYPTTADFDSIISYYDWTTIIGSKPLRQITSSLYYPFENYYIGFIANKDDENLSEKVSLFSDILEAINKRSSQKHTLVHDTISDKNKAFYLIKK